MSDREPIVAFDYTAIIKHRGKQFTINDMSLSKIGGVDLSAASVALVPSAMALLAGMAGLWLLTGVSVFWAAIPAIMIWVGFYWWFSRDVVDAQSPQDRIYLALSARRTQPVRLGGSSIGRPRKRGLAARVMSPALGFLLGRRHTAEDNNPGILRWTVIVKRPDDRSHLALGAAVPGRHMYRPHPQDIGRIVADDHDQFDDWYAYLRKHTPAI